VKPRFFRTPADLRTWFEKHHASARELWVGYYKKHLGRPSVTWPESVDEALAVGWIDGIRRRIDETRYANRFTPRRPKSLWSEVNIKRVRALARQKRMRPAGLKAFAARRENRSGEYSYEQRPATLEGPYARILGRNPRARDFFRSQPPYVQKVMTWWVVSAKQEGTRRRRLDRLIDNCARGRLMSSLAPNKR